MDGRGWVVGGGRISSEYVCKYVCTTNMVFDHFGDYPRV